MGRLLAVCLLGSCSGNEEQPPPPMETGTPPPVPTGDTSGPPPGPDLIITEANNYSYDPTWVFPQIPVRSSFDVLVGWSGLTSDAFDVQRPPTTYPRLLLQEVGAPIDEFLSGFADNTLHSSPSPLLGQWQAEVEGIVATNLSDLEAAGSPFDAPILFLEESSKAWFLALADVDEEILDIRAGLLLVPDDQSTATNAEFLDGANSLSFTCAFDGDPVRTTEGHDQYTADWRDLTTTVHGQPYDRFVADELFIGHWADGTSTADLALQVHDLQGSASSWWTMDVADDRDGFLELARDADGANFGGFVAGGTWVLGVRCSDCFGHAPYWLTVVEVEGS